MLSLERACGEKPLDSIGPLSRAVGRVLDVIFSSRVCVIIAKSGQLKPPVIVSFSVIVRRGLCAV